MPPREPLPESINGVGAGLVVTGAGVAQPQVKLNAVEFWPQFQSVTSDGWMVEAFVLLLS